MLKDLVTVPIGDVEVSAEVVYRDKVYQKCNESLSEARCHISGNSYYDSHNLSPDQLVLTNKSNVRSAKRIKQYVGIKFKDLRVGKSFYSHPDNGGVMIKQDDVFANPSTSGIAMKFNPDQIVFPLELNP
jgi:hypothetical protein